MKANDYITRHEALRALQLNFGDYYGAQRALCEIPAADVAPVVYGRWAHLGGDEWCCPVCGFVITTEGSWDKPTKKYCEDCGAKMDGGTDDGA